MDGEGFLAIRDLQPLGNVRGIVLLVASIRTMTERTTDQPPGTSTATARQMRQSPTRVGSVSLQHGAVLLRASGNRQDAKEFIAVRGRRDPGHTAD